MPTSPAQQCFRDLKSECREMRKYTIQALLTGESYTYEDVLGFFQPLFDNFVECLSALDNAADIWYARGEQFVAQSISGLVQKYVEKRDNEPKDKRFDEGTNTEDNIMGFPVINEDDCIENGARVRGQILLTIDELAEYLLPVPVSVIRGIVVTVNDLGQIVGYQLCGAKNS
jgi:hypothetical protein